MERRIVIESGRADPQFLARQVAELDSVERAVLDLSLRYGFSDQRLAEMLQITPDEVATRRETALAALAERSGLDAEGDRPRLEQALREVPHDIWLGRELEDPEPEPEMTAREADRQPGAAGGGATAHETPDASAAGASTARRSSRRAIAALLVLAAVVAAVAVIAWVAGDDGETPTQEPITAPGPDAQGGSASAGAGDGSGSQGAPGPAPDARPVALEPVPGAPTANASLQLVDAGPPAVVALRLGVPTPRRARYQVWLYDTVIDSRPLARVPRRADTVRFELGTRAADYRYLDVSLEDPGGVAAHSGRSVTRAELPATLAALGLQPAN